MSTLHASGSQHDNPKSIIDMDDDEGWEDMPVIRINDFDYGYEEEAKPKSSYTASHHMSEREMRDSKKTMGDLIDFSDPVEDQREAEVMKEGEYTRLRLQEEEDADEVHLRTKYLFDEDSAMTPLSQMQATKNLLTETQRIAYVGVCFLTCREFHSGLKALNHKELKAAVESLEVWILKIMARLYYHMELEAPEQKMIESLAEHGVQAADLVPPLMTTHKVANPEYDPAEAHRQMEQKRHDYETSRDESNVLTVPEQPPMSPTTSRSKEFQTTANILTPRDSVAIPGVSTTLSSADENVTLDIRWTVLCDLFLILVADSVYDARSRALLEAVAVKLGLTWLDVVKFEQRVTDALEIQEGVEKLEQREILEGQRVASKKRRYAMMGLATIGGGLVIGLSAGLLAPVIGAGLGAAFATIGVTGTTGFLAGAGGAAVITTAGTLTGSSIAARGMARRTQNVQIFELLPLHNNKRVSCILTVSGFMTSALDDVRLPFSVLDPVVGDVFSVLWEPQMLGETGSALKLLGGEILSQVGTTVLQATVMTALMSALQWPILLTKLGYLIDNPWSNALDRAKAAGSVLADVLIRRHLGVRPIVLIGFSLGARMIFYCLLELAKKKAYGIVQDVFMLGATLTASQHAWLQARSVVAGRLVNGYARNDWLLNYLFRATNAGLSSIAGLRPVQGVPGLENVDVTDKIAGHTSYRNFMPLILDQLGFPVISDYFDEPEQDDMEEDRIVMQNMMDTQDKSKRWFNFKRKKAAPSTNVPEPVRPPPSTTSWGPKSPVKEVDTSESDLPERETDLASADATNSAHLEDHDAPEVKSPIPAGVGFDIDAIKQVIGDNAPKGDNPPLTSPLKRPILPIPSMRTESTPPVIADEITPPSTALRSSSMDDIHILNSSMSGLGLGLSPSIPSPSPATTPSHASITPTIMHSAFPPSASTAVDEDEEFGEFGDSQHSSAAFSSFPQEPAPPFSTANHISNSFFTDTDTSIWAPSTSSRNGVFGQSSGEDDFGTFLSGASEPSSHLQASSYLQFPTTSADTLSFTGFGGSLTTSVTQANNNIWRPSPLTKRSNSDNNPWE